MNLKHLSFLILFLSCCISLNAQKKVAILVAGQSNTDGRVPASQFPVSFTDENEQTVNYLTTGQIPNTKYCRNNLQGTFSTWALGTSNWAYDAIVLKRLQHLLDDTVYEIKWAQGGVAISPKGNDAGAFWTTHFDEIPTGKTALMKNFEQSIKNAIQKNPGVFEIKAFLWHQGEGDYKQPASGDYYENFRDLIAYVREIVNNPTLPVIFGSISHKSTQYSSVVEDAQKRIVAEDANIYMVDMSDATLLDPYHFDAANSERLGVKMYEILRDKILVNSGIEDDIVDNPSFFIHPNPARNYLYIDSNVNANRFELYGQEGRLIFSDTDFIEKVDISSLENGVYFARIYWENKVLTQKVIIRN